MAPRCFGRGGRVQDFWFREVLPVESGYQVAGQGKIWRGPIAGQVDIPADVVRVEMRMGDDIHVGGAYALVLELVKQIAGPVTSFRMWTGAHAGIDEYNFAL